MSSQIPKALSSTKPPRPFRIFALPLAKVPKPHSLPLSPPPNPILTPTSDSHSPIAPPNTSSTPSKTPSTAQGESAKTPLLLFQTLQPAQLPSQGPPSLTSRALNKASETWLNLGKKPKNSWTFWFYERGEKLMDRIEFEEWSLKAIKEGQGVKVDKEGKVVGERVEIPLIRPEIKGTTLPPLLPKLHRFLIHRIPYHRKMMQRSLIFIPVTWPFAIIPIIPNFPFFYVLWRAWSHYKAWRGAVYLETLLQNGLIVEQESKDLTKVYASKGIEGSENNAPDQTSSEGENLKDLATDTTTNIVRDGSRADEAGIPGQAKGESGTAVDGTTTPESMVYNPSSSEKKEEKKKEGKLAKAGPIKSKAQHPSLLLSPSQVPLLAETFELSALEVIDVVRAIEQADYRARKADKEKADKEKSDKEEGVKGDKEKKEGEKGTEWRGNLHR
ncbi:hypothetical protein I302_107479 [Kwoniella bestiolae CBS 10118]|uniref:Mitochondrial K+-H+ exchange-related-domain-containing protein n=1 Tax=Kwoniella bestiolae CBS 10118 TaxID=1296100 RepID=A0A1B9FYE4_9TREE|nr:hypothetical protein I302_06780 [Kwoniella bestiolae CBS 10118]OCF23796.1 hypothetical protein I302_06780 [Kwoniella bestiolae CBS 10118]